MLLSAAWSWGFVGGDSSASWRAADAAWLVATDVPVQIRGPDSAIWIRDIWVDEEEAILGGRWALIGLGREGIGRCIHSLCNHKLLAICRHKCESGYAYVE